MKKVTLSLIVLMVGISLPGQKLTKESVMRYLMVRYDSVFISRHWGAILRQHLLDSALGAGVDMKFEEPAKGWKKIEQVDSSDVTVMYLLLQEARDVRTFAQVMVRTKSGQKERFRNQMYEYAKENSFYMRWPQHNNEMKSFAFVLNDSIVPEKNAARVFSSIPYKDIRYIDVIAGYDKPIYGENSRWGTLFIWTKEKKDY